MAKNSRIVCYCLLIFSILLSSGCASKPQPSQKKMEIAEQSSEPIGSPDLNVPSDEVEPEDINAVEGWAVLAEKDDFSDVGKTNMLVDYIDNKRLNQTLMEAGWDADHIHELRGFDRDSLVTELD